MRLTLRTMLAYMDDILESEDKQVIGKRIEESEFATALLHRTRDAMRRFRLEAPDVTDRAKGLDPNTVAEYLDNTLPHDRVTDFEKVCLESDVHLAEVASCHQVLTLVLGEPAEVDPDSRQRMYRLPEFLAAKTETEGQAADPASAYEEGRADVEPTVTPRRSKPTVPEYLRDSRRRRFRPAVAAVILVLAAVVLALVATGQFKPETFWGSVFNIGSTEESKPRAPLSSADGSIPPDVSPSDTGKPTEAGPATIGSQAVDTRPLVRPKPEDRSSIPSKDEVSAATTPASRPAEVSPAAAKAAAPTTPDVKPFGPKEGDLVSPAPSALPLDKPAEEAGAKPPADPPLPPQAEMGVFLSPGEILLKFDPATATWKRQGGEAALVSGDILLSLPTFRPSIELADQLRLQLVDGTRIRLERPDAGGVPGVVVECGRVVIRTADEAPARLRFRAGDLAGVITFADAESVLAIEVSRSGGTNVDPETQPAPLVVDLFATTGKIYWQDGTNREPVGVTPPMRLTLTEHPLETIPLQQIPGWIESDTNSPLDRRASGLLSRAVKVDRPVILTLSELADDRQKEVRWLAMRCLGWIGDFAPMVLALNDRDQKLAWSDYIEQLRAAVRRDPLAAAQVRTAMERQHGAEGASLYEMLWKYDVKELEEDAARLIEYLQHKTLAFRVLSFWNLNRITGLGFFYHPEEIAADRFRAVQRWKERLLSKPSPRTGQSPDEVEPPASKAPPAKASSVKKGDNSP